MRSDRPDHVAVSEPSHLCRVRGVVCPSDQLAASSRQPRTHRADRAVENCGRLLVGQIHELRQNEGFHLRARKTVQQRRSEAGLHHRRFCDRRSNPFHEVPVAFAAPHVVGADVAADPQQPRHDGSVTAEPWKGSDRLEICLLDEVFDLAGRSEGVAQFPHGGLCEANELGQRRIITFDCTRHQVTEQPVVEHEAMVADQWANRQSRTGANSQMNSPCEAVQSALSARVDGEPEEMEPGLVDAHLAHCVDCQAFESRIGDLRARSRIAAAPVMPDLGPRTARAAAQLDRRTSSFIARWLLALIAAQIAIFSLSDLFATDVHDEIAHAARHLGAFTLAYAVGLATVVARPARARTMLGVGLVLTGALFITGIVDVAQGRVPWLGEATHIPELISVGLLWLLARTPRSRTEGTGAGVRPVPLGADDER